jgi:predicted metal-binding protein
LAIIAFRGRDVNGAFDIGRAWTTLPGMKTKTTRRRRIAARHVEALKQHGACDVVEIRAADVVVADWVLEKCQFGCSGYNQCLTCPPRSPSPDQMRRILAGYQRALLVHFVHEIRSVRQWPRVRKIMAGAERELFLDGFEKAWALAAGPCELCEECTLDECRHPKLARPAMEACGIDVFATAHAAGLPIQVVTSRDQPIDLYCLLLVD